MFSVVSTMNAKDSIILLFFLPGFPNILMLIGVHGKCCELLSKCQCNFSSIQYSQRGTGWMNINQPLFSVLKHTWNIGISLNFPRRRIVTASRDGNSQDVKASH